MSTPWTLANWFGCGLTIDGRARFQPRLAIRRRHEDHGVADRRGFWRARGGVHRRRRRAPAAGSIRSRRIRNGAKRGGAGFQRGLAPHDLVELLVELLLVEQLPAGGAIDLGAQFGDAVFIGVLHLGLTGDQPGQDVVAKGEIGRGRRRPHAEHDDRADDDPEHDRPEPDLLAGMDDGIAVTGRSGSGGLRPAPARGATGHDHGDDGAGGTRNDDRNGTTSALPRRSERSSVRLNLRGRFDPVMVNFWEMEPGKSKALCGCGQHLVGMAVDPDIAPDPGDPAIGADQNRCANNPRKVLPYMDFSPQAP